MIITGSSIAPDFSTLTRVASLVPDWRRTRCVSGFLAITVAPGGGVSSSTRGSHNQATRCRDFNAEDKKQQKGNCNPACFRSKHFIAVNSHFIIFVW